MIPVRESLRKRKEFGGMWALGVVIVLTVVIGSALWTLSLGGAATKNGVETNNQQNCTWTAEKSLNITVIRYRVNLLPNETVCVDDYYTETIHRYGYQSILVNATVVASHYVTGLQWFKINNNGDDIYHFHFRLEPQNSSGWHHLLFLRVHFTASNGSEKAYVLIKNGHWENRSLLIVLQPRTWAMATFDLLAQYQVVNYTVHLSYTECLEETLPPGFNFEGAEMQCAKDEH